LPKAKTPGAFLVSFPFALAETRELCQKTPIMHWPPGRVSRRVAAAAIILHDHHQPKCQHTARLSVPNFSTCKVLNWVCRKQKGERTPSRSYLNGWGCNRRKDQKSRYQQTKHHQLSQASRSPITEVAIQFPNKPKYRSKYRPNSNSEQTKHPDNHTPLRRSQS